MRLRYAQLQRRQEQMIAEMERAIYKRDNIEAKGKVLAQKKGAPPTQAALQKQVAELSKKLQLTTHDANLTQMNVLKLQEEQQSRGDEVEQHAAAAGEVQQQVEAAKTGISTQMHVEHLQQVQLLAQSKLARRLVAAAEGAYTPQASEGELRERIAEGDDTQGRLLGVVDALSAEAPHYAPVLTSMVQAVTAR